MDYWQRVRHLTGKTFHTVGRGKEFKLDTVQDNYLVVIPHEGVPRVIERESFERGVALGLGDNNLTLARLREALPQNRDLSYLLAILREVT